MKKKVAVSSAQRSAAKAMVRRSAVTGRYVSKSVHKIANAKSESHREQAATTTSTKASAAS